MRLLLQSEVAQILRCSEETVKRLRLTGKLPYIPGRPVLIEAVDLDAYIEGKRKAAEQKANPVKPIMDADKWVRLKLLTQRTPKRKLTE